MLKPAPHCCLATIVSLAAIWLLGCQRVPSPMEAKKELIGQYKLFIGADKTFIRNKDLLSSTLVLRSDGTFEEECIFQNKGRSTIDGSWHYFEGNVQFSRFRDCAGVWPSEIVKEDGAASLIVRFSKPPIILISPDVNVFYERVEVN